MSFLGLGALWRTRRRFASELAARRLALRDGRRLLPHVVGRTQLARALRGAGAAAVRPRSGGAVVAEHAAGPCGLRRAARGQSRAHSRSRLGRSRRARLQRARRIRAVDGPRGAARQPAARDADACSGTAARDRVLAAAWGAAAVVSWLLSRWRAGAGEADATRACGALACTLMIGATLGWRITGARRSSAGPGFCASRPPLPHAGGSSGFRGLASRRRGQAFAGVRVPSARPSDGAGRRSAVRRAESPGGPVPGRCATGARRCLGPSMPTVGRRVAPLVRAAARPHASRTPPMRLDLPAGAQVLTIGGDSAARREHRSPRTADRCRSATALTPRFAHRVVRYGNVAVWFLDEGAFAEPEGWWVGGRAAATVMLDAPRTVTTAALLVRNGGVPNRIALTAGCVERHAGPDAGRGAADRRTSRRRARAPDGVERSGVPPVRRGSGQQGRARARGVGSGAVNTRAAGGVSACRPWSRRPNRVGRRRPSPAVPASRPIRTERRRRSRTRSGRSSPESSSTCVLDVRASGSRPARRSSC